VGTGARVLSFGRFQNPEGIAACAPRDQSPRGRLRGPPHVGAILN
jgi:hypothetical protein